MAVSSQPGCASGLSQGSTRRWRCLGGSALLGGVVFCLAAGAGFQLHQAHIIQLIAISLMTVKMGLHAEKQKAQRPEKLQGISRKQLSL